MKHLFTVLLLAVCVTGMAYGQTYQWDHIGVWPPAGVTAGDTLFGGDVHGLAVDGAGKLWVQLFGTLAKDTILIPNYLADVDTSSVDSVQARQVRVRALYVFNPDGSQAPFSPILVTNVGGKNDTLGGASVYVKGQLVWHPSLSPNTGRGLKADRKGNILATYFGYVYRFAPDGTCLSKTICDPAASLVAAAADADDYMYINRVVAGDQKILQFDLSTQTFIQNAVDTIKGYSRTIEVSSDANSIYYAGYTNHAIWKYKGTNGYIGPWDQKPDTILKGFDCESMCWNNTTGELWASAGSYNDLPNRYPNVTTTYDPGAWYAVDPVTDQPTGEKINWVFRTPASAAERPRGIAFSSTGDTAFVGIFGTNLPTPGLRAYKRVVTSVQPIEDGIPSGFSLSQNYPNPFNPTTEIQFALAKSGMTTLKVYDMLGKEIMTLVNQDLNAGSYRAKFDASHLSSGTYIYVLTSNGVRLTNKMMLMK